MPKGIYDHSKYPRGEKHGCAKLTESQVRAIRKSSEIYTDLADRYEVCIATIGNIKARLLWRHVHDDNRHS
jgi:hypothetical protein